MSAHHPPAFGQELRGWRQTRGWSQLELALRAAASQRHISFLETGRSRPREEMVLRLARVLEVPLRERNRWLVLAGLPPAYPERATGDALSAPFQAAVAEMLQRHAPLPALVMNGWWDLVGLNDPARRLFSSLYPGPVNMIEALFAPGPLRSLIDNWDEVAVVTLQRLHREARQMPADARLHRLLQQAETCVRRAGLLQASRPPADPMVVCPTFRLGTQRIPTFSMIAHFNAPQDIALQELRVELIFPRDAAGEAALRALAAPP